MPWLEPVTSARRPARSKRGKVMGSSEAQEIAASSSPISRAQTSGGCAPETA